MTSECPISERTSVLPQRVCQRGPETGSASRVCHILTESQGERKDIQCGLAPGTILYRIRAYRPASRRMLLARSYFHQMQGWPLRSPISPKALVRARSRLVAVWCSAGLSILLLLSQVSSEPSSAVSRNCPWWCVSLRLLLVYRALSCEINHNI